VSQKQSLDKFKGKIIDYKQTFGSPHGQRVLRDLMKRFHIMKSTHVSGDPYETAFREGERHVLVTLMSTLKIDPDKLGEIMKQGENE
jgi:hypothetical protein